MYQKLKRHIQGVINASDSEFDYFISKTKLVSLEKNEIWKSEGKISQELTYVHSGLLRHFYMDDGKEKTEKFYMEGSWFGNFGSFLAQTPSLRNYAAIEKSELSVLSFSELNKLYLKFPKMERFGRLYLQQILIYQQNRSRSLMLDSAKTRYIKFKADFPELPQRVPQYLIAQYLGVKPETLSRIRKEIN